MSVIGKKPLINRLLENLNATQLANLKSALNSANSTHYNDGADLYNNGTIGLVNIPGYSGIYFSHTLFVFSKNSQLLKPYTVTNGGNLEAIDEYCDINELRSSLDDRLIEVGAIVPENVKFIVSNIKALTDAECNDLKVGDMVAKKTGDMYHNYIVTYKEDETGICLTYADASVVETQSYDYTAGHWVYNSEDKTTFADIRGLPDYPSSTGTFVLKCVNGVLTWVEETA